MTPSNNSRLAVIFATAVIVAAVAAVVALKVTHTSHTARPAPPTATVPTVLSPTAGPGPSVQCLANSAAQQPVSLVTTFYRDIQFKKYKLAWCLGSTHWQAKHALAHWLPTVRGMVGDVSNALFQIIQPNKSAVVDLKLSVTYSGQLVARILTLTWHLRSENGRWTLDWKRKGGRNPPPTATPGLTPTPTLPLGVTPTPTLSHGQVTVDSIVKRMTLKQKVGQMFMGGFGTTSSDTTVTPELSTFLQKYQPGGITLFTNNIGPTPADVTALTAHLQAGSKTPLFVSTDQEGGQVERLTFPGYTLSSESTYGQVDDPTTVYNDAYRLGGRMKSLGINMNLAPVVDVATNPSSAINQEQRSFGAIPSTVSTLSVKAINGYQDAGIAATAKHFLGLGTSVINADNSLATINLTRAQLRAQLQPFRAATRAHVDSIMVTHVILPGITGPKTPASLSFNVVTKMIRGRLRYKGVIMTDSLSMGSVVGYTASQAAITAIKAGEDIVLIAGNGNDAIPTIKGDINTIVGLVKNGTISERRINRSVDRIIALKLKLGLFPSAAH